jgi:hypothetical protein
VSGIFLVDTSTGQFWPLPKGPLIDTMAKPLIVFALTESEGKKKISEEF